MNKQKKIEHQNSVLLLGAGLQARACAYDLLRSDDRLRLTVVDNSEKQLEELVSFCNAKLKRKPQSVQLDLRKLPEREIGQLFLHHRLVLSCVPYYLNAELTQIAVSGRVHFVDLGGNTNIVRRQHEFNAQAKEAGITIVPDCGLMPGLGNNIAGSFLRTCPDARSEVYIYCGGLPQQKVGLFDYKLVFSVEGLLNEYFGKALVIDDFQLKEVDTFSEYETLFCPPLGKLEAFTTSGGSSTAPINFQQRIKTYSYKTLRYPGHFAKFKLLKQLGLLDEIAVHPGAALTRRQLLENILKEKLDFPEIKDLVVLIVRIINSTHSYQVKLIDYHDDKSDLSAMQRTTGFVATAVCRLILSGTLPKGVLANELDVPFELLRPQLEARGFHFRKIKKSLLTKKNKQQ